VTLFSGLSEQICSDAFDLVKPVIAVGSGLGTESGSINKHAGSVVVLNPAIPYEPKYRQAFANGNFNDLVLWERQVGNPRAYDLAKYTGIARAKAFTSYLTGLPSHQVQQQFPALYVPGMTKWGGSAVAGSGPMRLIVAFSGVQWNFDQMISEMMISAIQALCHEQMREVMESDEPMITAGSGEPGWW
jgi:hypothetical protein